MDFGVSDEHRALRTMLRGFFEAEAPVAVMAEIDREERYPAELYAKMADIGLCGITIPEDYGGSAADEISLCIVAEEVARAGASLQFALMPTITFCAKAIGQYGSEDQKQAYLPKIAAGELRFAMGLTEPEAGSDLTRLATRATVGPAGVTLSGQKVFTTGADTADFILTLARTSVTGSRRNSMSLVIVPREAAGVTIRPLRKLAGQGTHTCEVFLDDVLVPVENIVGDVGAGLSVLFDLLDGERIVVGAEGCGIAQGAYDAALRHSGEREQFGRPIADFQAIGHLLTDMAMEIEAARMMVWRAAWKLENGLPCSVDASMAKVIGSETGSRCATRGMQILGGYSYMVEYGMERYYRETKLNEIAGGSNEIQRNMILKQLRAGWVP